MVLLLFCSFIQFFFFECISLWKLVITKVTTVSVTCLCMYMCGCFCKNLGKWIPNEHLTNDNYWELATIEIINLSTNIEEVSLEHHEPAMNAQTLSKLSNNLVNSIKTHHAFTLQYVVFFILVVVFILFGLCECDKRYCNIFHWIARWTLRFFGFFLPHRTHRKRWQKYKEEKLIYQMLPMYNSRSYRYQTKKVLSVCRIHFNVLHFCCCLILFLCFIFIHIY